MTDERGGADAERRRKRRRSASDKERARREPRLSERERWNRLLDSLNKTGSDD